MKNVYEIFEAGITLTELLVATVMIGIVMIAVISVDLAVRHSQQSSSKDALLTAQVQAAMTKISRDAGLTVGYETDPGIQQFSGGSNTICFRHDVADAQGKYSPEFFLDDTWTCWEAETTTGSLWNCWNLDSPPPGCSSVAASQKKKWLTVTDTNFFEVVMTPENQIDRINIQLTSRANPAQARNPLTNPEYSLASSISPPGLSR